MKPMGNYEHFFRAASGLPIPTDKRFPSWCVLLWHAENLKSVPMQTLLKRAQYGGRKGRRAQKRLQLSKDGIRKLKQMLAGRDL